MIFGIEFSFYTENWSWIQFCFNNNEKITSMTIWPSANKDSNCWGQDISSSYSKSIENTRLSLCFFKTMASKEIMQKISW